MTPRMTTIPPDISNTQETVIKIQENIINTTRQSVSDNTDSGNFQSNIEKAIQNVSDTQKQSAEITKNFELGFVKNNLWRRSYERDGFIESIKIPALPHIF